MREHEWREHGELEICRIWHDLGLCSAGDPAGCKQGGTLRFAYGAAFIFSTAALVLAPAASASHLAMPESALFSEGKIYVSLIGDPENNDGAIVIVDARGRVTRTLARASTAKPLSDPTGMATIGSTLWVNDGTRIRSYDLRTGAAGRVIDIAGSVFVNDLAVDRRGNLWASDSETRMLYRVNAAGRWRAFACRAGSPDCRMA